MLNQNYINAGPDTSQIEQVAAEEFNLPVTMINKFGKTWSVFAGLKFFHQHFLTAAAYINGGFIAHDEVPAFTFDVFVYLVQVNHVGMMYAEKRIFLQHFFYFFKSAGCN